MMGLLLSLDTWSGVCVCGGCENDLVLLQVGMPDLVDTPRMALPPMSSGWGMGSGEVRRQGQLGLVCKIKSKFFFK